MEKNMAYCVNCSQLGSNKTKIKEVSFTETYFTYKNKKPFYVNGILGNKCQHCGEINMSKAQDKINSIRINQARSKIDDS